MRKKRCLLAAALAVSTMILLPQTGMAGAKIKINDDADIDLGFRLQAQYLNNDKDIAPPREENQFRIRRARMRLGANVTKWYSMFLQTEFAPDPGTGADMRVIDAFINVHPSPLFQIVAGENMAPASRQNVTSSGGLMAWDRPSQTNKVVTWGTRAVGSLQTRTLPGTDAGLRGDVDVRDLGFTLFGIRSFSDITHGKYYIGAYQGATSSGSDKRIAGRLQVNFFDPESGYFNTSTYLGKKTTVGLGGSFDLQNKLAFDSVTGNEVDYKWYSLDAFADYPMGPGHLTVEAAYNTLDLDDSNELVAIDPSTTAVGSGNPTLGVAGKQSQGKGFYIQSGYYMAGLFGLPGGWQPWVEYEQWSSDGVADAGSYDQFRVGLTYFVSGHNANIKVGYEKISPDDSSQSDIDTLGVGLYMTY